MEIPRIISLYTRFCRQMLLDFRELIKFYNLRALKSRGHLVPPSRYASAKKNRTAGTETIQLAPLNVKSLKILERPHLNPEHVSFHRISGKDGKLLQVMSRYGNIFNFKSSQAHGKPFFERGTSIKSQFGYKNLI